jgi:hypothetical protein
MFSLKNDVATLANVNPRAELHGEDRQPACDLRIDMSVSNGLLAEFHPTLRSFLFEKDSGQLDLGDELTKLRMPKLGPLKYSEELVGAEVTIHRGLGGKSDITLPGCSVNNFTLDAQEGGSVGLSFRIQGHPDEKQFGRLCSCIGTEIEISIEPPSGEQQDLGDGE